MEKLKLIVYNVKVDEITPGLIIITNFTFDIKAQEGKTWQFVFPDRVLISKNLKNIVKPEPIHGFNSSEIALTFNDFSMFHRCILVAKKITTMGQIILNLIGATPVRTLSVLPVTYFSLFERYHNSHIWEILTAHFTMFHHLLSLNLN